MEPQIPEPEFARTESPDRWRRWIAIAGPQFLDACLANPATGEEELVILLRNRRVSPAQLRQISNRPEWVRSREVKRGLVQHPHCPLPLGRRMLPHLHWQEIASVAEELRIHAVLRKQAEKLIKTRLPSLTEGERITLARRCTKGVIPALMESDSAKVVQSLLWNPHLIEGDAATIAAAECTPKDCLTLLVKHPRWARSRAVRLALATNERTPTAVALGLLQHLTESDLRNLADNAKVPKLIRMGAERVLAPVDPATGDSPEA